MNDHILIVENDQQTIDFLRSGLTHEGFRVSVVADGAASLVTARDDPPDLVVLDWGLPGIDGIEICKLLRAISSVPIILLAAEDTVSDRVTGLNAGADVYIVKPFTLDELLAHIRAQLRRAHSELIQVLRFEDLAMNCQTREAYRRDRKLDLTAKEYELLELFLRHPGVALTRDVIYQHIWSHNLNRGSRIIEVYVRYLRQKLEADGEPRLIQTVRGVGYALNVE